MAQIFGAIEIGDVSTFADTVGQRLIYDATLQYLAMVNADMATALGVFVEPTPTEDYKERYQLPGGGRLQRRGTNSQPGATKAYGSWDVAYPLEDFGAQIAGDDVTLAYMSVAEYERHVQNIVIQNINTVRFEVLKALLNNTARTFVDPLRGSLTIQPLALASDSVVYPPVLGSESEATDTHHLETGYASSSISDTNDPIVTAVDELVEHFGEQTGNSNLVTFINNAQVAKISSLTQFVEVPDQYIRAGTATDVPQGLPNVPGKIIGRHEYGSWISVWRWIPANYLVTVHLEVPQPLKMRVDPAATGLGRGLQLVARSEVYPFQDAFWRHRFGIGVSNRLNGVVLELGTGGSYSIPSGYA